MVCRENDNETQAEIKQKSNYVLSFMFNFSKSEPWTLNFVTEKFVTSRVRLDKQMPFACNKLNFDHCFDMCQSLTLKRILNHSPHDIIERN